MHPIAFDDVDLVEAYSWSGVTLRANMIETLDGSTTGPDGLSGSIGTPADRAIFIAVRRTADLILVGAGTFRAEQYQPPKSDATLCVVSRGLDVLDQVPVLHACTARPIILTCADSNADVRAALAEVADVLVCGETHVDLKHGVTQLRDRGFKRLLTEGGPSLLGSLINEGLVDDLCLSIAAKFAPAIGAHHLAAGLEYSTNWRISQALYDAEGVYLRLRPA